MSIPKEQKRAGIAFIVVVDQPFMVKRRRQGKNEQRCFFMLTVLFPLRFIFWGALVASGASAKRSSCFDFSVLESNHGATSANDSSVVLPLYPGRAN
jgi:hypothetical protein